MAAARPSVRRRIAIAFVALFVAAFAPWFVFGQHLPRLVTADGAIDRAQCVRSSQTPPPPPGNVTVLVVAGLGFDSASPLPELNWLFAQAAARPLAVEFPSYTTPALLSFATGVGPRLSGIRLNASTREPTRGLDNLQATAQSVGRSVDFFDGGWDPFGEIMFAAPTQLWRGRRAMEAAPYLSRKERSLRFVYIGDVDTAGHLHGEGSEEFRQASIAAAARMHRFVTQLGTDDRLLIVSDHGHLLSGGHGGVEPEILRASFFALGKDARAGVTLPVRPLDDVSSTIAALAGIPAPACNTGLPMLDMFALSDTNRVALKKPIEEQRTKALKLVAPDSDPMKAGRLAALVAGVLALGYALRRHLPDARSWLAPVAMTIGYVGVLAIRGYRLTFSKMPPQSAFIIDASIASVVAIGLVLFACWKLRLGRPDVAVLAGLAVPMLGMAAWLGVNHHIVPPPYVGLAVILWAPPQIAGALLAVGLSFRAGAGDAEPTRKTG